MTDFRTIMIADCNAARSDAEHLSALTSFLTGFGDVRRSEDLIAMLQDASTSASSLAQQSTMPRPR